MRVEQRSRWRYGTCCNQIRFLGRSVHLPLTFLLAVVRYLPSGNLIGELLADVRVSIRHAAASRSNVEAMADGPAARIRGAATFLAVSYLMMSWQCVFRLYATV